MRVLHNLRLERQLVHRTGVLRPRRKLQLLCAAPRQALQRVARHQQLHAAPHHVAAARTPHQPLARRRALWRRQIRLVEQHVRRLLEHVQPLLRQRLDHLPHVGRAVRRQPHQRRPRLRHHHLQLGRAPARAQLATQQILLRIPGCRRENPHVARLSHLTKPLHRQSRLAKARRPDHLDVVPSAQVIEDALLRRVRQELTSRSNRPIRSRSHCRRTTNWTNRTKRRSSTRRRPGRQQRTRPSRHLQTPARPTDSRQDRIEILVGIRRRIITRPLLCHRLQRVIKPHWIGQTAHTPLRHDLAASREQRCVHRILHRRLLLLHQRQLHRKQLLAIVGAQRVLRHRRRAQQWQESKRIKTRTSEECINFSLVSARQATIAPQLEKRRRHNTQPTAVQKHSK